VRVVARARGCALVESRPITGRPHQIRAHLAAVGHPIVGDKLYAHGDEVFRRFCDEGESDELMAVLGLPRHALHAAVIDVPHPSGDRLRVEAPLPADLAAYLERSG
jgi:23S rRNA pseudouridine1911/1915/1917 synthase